MSNTLFRFCLLLCLLQAAVAGAQQTASPMTLEAYQWKNRPLLLFSPAADNPLYNRQKKILSTHDQGLRERDMVVLEIIGNGEVYLNGTRQEGMQGQHLRERFKVPQQEFTVILVGKDGTEKLRRQEATEIEDIFRLIDQMPMRQQEMRRDGQ